MNKFKSTFVIYLLCFIGLEPITAKEMIRHKRDVGTVISIVAELGRPIYEIIREHLKKKKCGKKIDSSMVNNYYNNNMDNSQALKNAVNARMAEAVEVISNLNNSTSEPGIFFGSRGGYVKLRDSFNVGVEIDIQMDIKPRNISGLLMSVHGRNDHLVLQMVDGVIKLNVNNGKGAFEAAFKPPTKWYFCDGQWHSIQAIKSKNIASLSVNRTFVDAGIGELHSTDTKYALFLGGHQVFSLGKKVRGLQTRRPFTGCIRDVKINNEPVPVHQRMLSGDVVLGACPTD